MNPKTITLIYGSFLIAVIVFSVSLYAHEWLDARDYCRAYGELHGIDTSLSYEGRDHPFMCVTTDPATHRMEILQP